VRLVGSILFLRRLFRRAVYVCYTAARDSEEVVSIDNREKVSFLVFISICVNRFESTEYLSYSNDDKLCVLV
jgi:hypothetical protein